MTRDDALRLGAHLLRQRAKMAPNLAGKYSRPEIVFDLMEAAEMLESMRQGPEMVDGPLAESGDRSKAR